MADQELTKILRDFLGPEAESPLVSAPGCVWMRAHDLIVGLVRCPDDATSETVNAAVARAYAALDESGRLMKKDLWNVLLVIELDQSANETLIQDLNGDTRGSRKLAKRTTDPFPAIFGPLEAPGTPVISLPARSADLIPVALDREAQGPLRLALDVLLKTRRPQDEVNRLIELLAQD